ncbi:hypothetical protein SEA_SATIS_169 [Streptomyces phage Satis]|nr:hypothetical protein SEA_SATIS_169 [Streptomyces phage Satis]QBZ72065.1 hypothetical protein SEA_KRADAL_169 [Streptomyces phage Kradal]QPL14485.1 membrane protein [Streptomyces phage EhyElimayoE]
MDVLTWINTLVLGAVLVFGWIKLANGDEADGCCAVILLVLTVGLAALGFLAYGVGSLIGWW